MEEPVNARADNDSEDAERLRRRLEEEAMEQMLLAQDDDDDNDIDGPLGAKSTSSGFDDMVDDDGVVGDTPLLEDETPQDDLDLANIDDADDANNDVDEFVDEPVEGQQEFQPLLQEQQPNARADGGGGVFLFSRISYIKTSFGAALAMIWYAMRTRQQFYLACVYLQSSKWAYVVFGNCLVAFSISLFNFMTRFFLNGLRLPEAEGLGDYFRWNVTETCLALTMFRSELTIQTAILFLLLVVAKSLHWVAEMREGHLRMTEEAIVSNTLPDGTMGWPLLQWPHVRLFSFLSVLQLLDIMAVIQCGSDIMARGPSISILFAFEAAILLTSSMSSLLLWHLHVIDGMMHYLHEVTAPLASRQAHSEEENDEAGQEGADEISPMDSTPDPSPSPVTSDAESPQTHRSWIHRSIHGWIHPWKDHKATLIFAVEVQAQAAKFFFYVTFFAIVLTYYGMPINLFREVYLSFQSLKQRLVAFSKYRHLMASMNRFSSPSTDELDDAGPTCIICRDEMSTRTAKKLPGCGHVFHKSCLREWLVQQQTCPTCRGDISTLELRQRQQTAAQEREQQQQEQKEQESEAETAQEDKTLSAIEGEQEHSDGAMKTTEDGSNGSKEVHVQKAESTDVIKEPKNDETGDARTGDLQKGELCGCVNELGRNEPDNVRSAVLQPQLQDKGAFSPPDLQATENGIDTSTNESSSFAFSFPSTKKTKPPRNLQYPSSTAKSLASPKKTLRFAMGDDADEGDKKPPARGTINSGESTGVSLGSPSAMASPQPKTPPHMKKHVRITTPSAEEQVLYPNQFSTVDEVEYPVFPAFYRVAHDEGAPVWNDGDSVSFVIRRVPFGVVILGLELQWRHCSSVDEFTGIGYEDAGGFAAAPTTEGEVTFDDDDGDNSSKDHRLMLRMPDGWVREEDVERITAVPF